MSLVPRAACVNDLSGFGRCSLTTAISVLSVMGVQACPFPTAVLSKHTGFPSFSFTDLTGGMPAYLESWNDLSFDGIYAGFLGSADQIEFLQTLICHHRRQNKPPLVILDPVMGDSGSLYATYTQDMCDQMRRLVSQADIITPNVTEACLLTGTVYRGECLHTNEAAELAKRLCELGCPSVVITGIERDEILCNLVLDRGSMYFETVQKTAQFFSGTGDLFASVVTAAMLRGSSLSEAVQKAGTFISRATAYTLECGTPILEGVLFEPLLKELAD